MQLGMNVKNIILQDTDGQLMMRWKQKKESEENVFTAAKKSIQKSVRAENQNFALIIVEELGGRKTAIRKIKKHGILLPAKTVVKNLKLMETKTENFARLDVQPIIDLVAPLKRSRCFFNV